MPLDFRVSWNYNPGLRWLVDFNLTVLLANHLVPLSGTSENAIALLPAVTLTDRRFNCRGFGYSIFSRVPCPLISFSCQRSTRKGMSPSLTFDLRLLLILFPTKVGDGAV
jgi:hypothetical protein